MRKYFHPFKNLFLLTIVFAIFLSLQKILWPAIFSTLPAPPLWINFIVFTALYRPPRVGILYSYFLGWVFSFYTLAPLKLILFSIIIVYGVTLFIKSRLFMEGFFYFSVLSIIATFNFHVTWLSLSYLFETTSAPLDLVHRFVQVLLTPALAIPLYYFLISFDKVFSYTQEGDPGVLNL